VCAGEILVNKQMPTNTRDPVTNPAAMPDAFYRNAPVSWKGYSGGEKCVVDKVRAPAAPFAAPVAALRSAAALYNGRLLQL